MRTISMIEFPLDEYEKRIHGLFDKINEADCDAVLLCNKENLRYFCDYRSTAWDMEYEYPAMMVATLSGRIALITSTRRRLTAETTCCLDTDDIYDYDGFGEATHPAVCVNALLDVLKKLGVSKGRLGTETGVASRMRITYQDYCKLFSKEYGLQQVDFSQYISDLREIKSEREIEVMRKCSGIAASCFRNAMDKLELGVTTEDKFYHDYTVACFDMGTDDMPDLMIVEFGPERRQPNCMPGSKIYEDPDWCVFLDGGPSLKGYVSDIIRIGKLTEPRIEQKKFYDISLDCHKLCIAKVKPGYSINELCRNHDDFMIKYNVQDICQTMMSCGHGVGLDIHELPLVKYADGSDRVFKPGMVFAFEPTMIHPKEGQIVLENNYLVTENGCENLSPDIQESIYVPKAK